MCLSCKCEFRGIRKYETDREHILVNEEDWIITTEEYHNYERGMYDCDQWAEGLQNNKCQEPIDLTNPKN